ncbi:hypothetical protein [Enterococcus sp. AZ072]|uniref:hypothetical protein n=1 Tax=unclassified Enterococcus TaxID=2608891 RepID=UPI003D26FEAE
MIDLLLRRFEEKESPYVFNIYLYDDVLIGIEEDYKYRQLSEMTPYGTPTDYFNWRQTQTGFGSLLDIHGKPLLKDQPRFKFYRGYLSEVAQAENIPIRKWHNRAGK